MKVTINWNRKETNYLESVYLGFYSLFVGIIIAILSIIQAIAGVFLSFGVLLMMPFLGLFGVLKREK